MEKRPLPSALKRNQPRPVGERRQDPGCLGSGRFTIVRPSPSFFQPDGSPPIMCNERASRAFKT